ncbi:MAG: response regulator [Anaerolineae bacterium]|jgi:signal transduction histidine kinase/CheY-like chemotaxis protein
MPTCDGNPEHAPSSLLDDMPEAERDSCNLSQLAAELPYAVAITQGPTHRLILANSRFERMTGERDLRGQSLDSVWPGPPHALGPFLDRAYHEKRPFYIGDVPIQPSDDRDVEPCRVSLICTPRCDASDRIIGLLMMGIESTELIRAHGEGEQPAMQMPDACCQSSEVRYRRLFNRLGDAFVLYEFIYDDEGNPCDLRYLDVNPMLAGRLGRSREEIIGRTVGALFPSTLPSALARLTRVDQTGEPERFEHVDEITGHQYESLAFSLTAGQCATISRDITEQRRAEQALRDLNETLEQRAKERTEQLRALAAELGRAEERERQRTARILHDHMQQLLVATQMQVDIVRNADPDLQSVALDRIHEMIAESIRTSRTLTAELSPPLLYDAGLPAALDWLGRWKRERYGLIVDLDIDDEAQVPDEGLRAFLFRSARELLLNVVKHAGTHRATLSLKRYRGEVCLTVEDAGKGMATEHASARQNTFGLFSIRERIEYLGGHMELVSAPGQGTRITLCAPLQIQIDTPIDDLPVDRSERHPVERQTPPASGIIRVLVADDHRIMRQGLVMLLEQEHDIRVVGEAENGRQAVELARALFPDVALMDVSMPLMDGIEATSIIHRDLPRVQVVGLSMFAEQEMAQRMYNAGAADYLSKSGDLSEIVRAIRRAARVRRDR